MILCKGSFSQNIASAKCGNLPKCAKKGKSLIYWQNFQNLHKLRNYSDSSYTVNKFRALNFFQNNDGAFKAELKRAKFVVFYDRQPLVNRVILEQSKNANFGPEGGPAPNEIDSLGIVSFKDLKKASDVHKFSLNDENIALLDVLPMQGETNDVNEEWIPLAALGLKVSHFVDAPSLGSQRNLAKDLNGEFVDLRRAYFLLHQPKVAYWLSKAQALLRWSNVYNFCPKCASSLVTKITKSSAGCPTCKQVYYPTISPVAIVLISDHSNENLLLVRQPRQVPGIFTAVAGFCEPGECLEETVIRETAEEVGLDVSGVKYANLSRCWPFPQNSLMVAFRATADMNEKLCIDRSELEHGRWFNRLEVQKAFDATSSKSGFFNADFSSIDLRDFRFTPPYGTIAHDLIKNWLEHKN